MPFEITHDEIAPGKVVVTLAGKLMVGHDGEPIVPLVEDLLREGKRIIIFDLFDGNRNRHPTVKFSAT